MICGKKMMNLLCLCIFGMILFIPSAVLAGQETYILDHDMVYRVDADGNRALLEEEQPGQYATEKGLYSWILVDPELSDAMEGSESGIYFFDESETSLGFLPFQGAAYCAIAFSPDGERFLVSFGTDVSQEIILYNLEGFEKKISFNGSGFAEWIDFARFAFTLDDATKGPRSKALDQQKGWLSVAVYDSLMEELFSVMEATETQDYMLIGANTESDMLEILERSVENARNWNEEEKIQEREISVPIPAAG